MNSYTNYKESILNRLVEATGKTWNDGIWAATGTRLQHILPLDSDKNTKENRAAAIKEYLQFDCSECLGNLNGLHQYAHHINSSQLLCMMFFQPMVKDKSRLVKFVKDFLGISISENATCSFEYTEKHAPYIFNVSGGEEYEGTCFDFHIKDGSTEIFFEIKLTEYGFGKATEDERHTQKAEQYVKLLSKQYTLEKTEMLQHYQIFRNLTRASNENSYVVFITDGDNPQTNSEISDFQEKYDMRDNVRFLTWQEIAEKYQREELPFQLKAIRAENK